MTLGEKGIFMALDKFCKAIPPGKGIPAGAKVRSYRSELIAPDPYNCPGFPDIPIKNFSSFAVDSSGAQVCQTLSDRVRRHLSGPTASALS